MKQYLYYGLMIAALLSPIACAPFSSSWHPKSVGVNERQDFVYLCEHPEEFPDYRQNLAFLKTSFYAGRQDCAALFEDMMGVTALTLNSVPVKNLRLLDRHYNALSLELAFAPLDDLSGVSSLTKLRDVTLRGLPLKDAAELGKLPKLTSLVISETKLEDFSFLKSLAGLEKLAINGQGVFDLELLAGMDKLRELELSNVELLNHLTLAKLKSLHNISLANCGGVSLSDLQGLAQLEGLSVYEGNLQQLAKLVDLPQLKRLDMKSVSLDESELALLREKRPDLEIHYTPAKS